MPNLRSRGDGPGQHSLVMLSANKPPLTRRWTRLGGEEDNTIAQTSAHAEMDPFIPVTLWGVLANLRSRGDGPVSAGY